MLAFVYFLKIFSIFYDIFLKGNWLVFGGGWQAREEYKLSGKRYVN